MLSILVWFLVLFLVAVGARLIYVSHVLNEDELAFYLARTRMMIGLLALAVVLLPRIILVRINKNFKEDE